MVNDPQRHAGERLAPPVAPPSVFDPPLCKFRKVVMSTVASSFAAVILQSAFEMPLDAAFLACAFVSGSVVWRLDRFLAVNVTWRSRAYSLLTGLPYFVIALPSETDSVAYTLLCLASGIGIGWFLQAAFVAGILGEKRRAGRERIELERRTLGLSVAKRGFASFAEWHKHEALKREEERIAPRRDEASFLLKHGAGLIRDTRDSWTWANVAAYVLVPFGLAGSVASSLVANALTASAFVYVVLTIRGRAGAAIALGASSFLPLPLSDVTALPADIGETEGRIVRGEKRLSAYQGVAAHAETLVAAGEPGWNFVGLILPFATADSGTFVVGETGSGKTTVIKSMLASTLRRYEANLPTRVVVYDPESQLLPVVEDLVDRVIVFDPAEGAWLRWVVSRDCRTEDQAGQLADAVVSLLPTGSGGQGGVGRDVFVNATTLILTAVIRGLMAESAATGDEWDLTDVLRPFRSIAALRELFASSAQGDLAAGMTGSTSNFAGESYSVAVSCVSPLLRAAEAMSSATAEFSIAQWFESRSVLVLKSDDEKRSTLDPLYAVLLQLMSERLLGDVDRSARTGRDGSAQTWLYVDEFVNLGRIPAFLELFARGRKRQIATVIGTQSVGAIEALYGRAGLDTIWTNAKNRVVLSNDGETADWVAGRLGKVTVRLNDVSVSESRATDYEGNVTVTEGSSESVRRYDEEVVTAREIGRLESADSTGRIGIIAKFGKKDFRVTLPVAYFAQATTGRPVR